MAPGLPNVGENLGGHGVIGTVCVPYEESDFAAIVKEPADDRLHVPDVLRVDLFSLVAIVVGTLIGHDAYPYG